MNRHLRKITFAQPGPIALVAWALDAADAVEIARRDAERKGISLGNAPPTVSVVAKGKWGEDEELRWVLPHA